VPGPQADDHAHVPPRAGELFRAHGRRLTAQRRVIWEVLAEEPDRHLSADDVVARTRDRVDPSTVYRTLELLVEEGLARRTDLGDDRAYYEPAHEHRHHHLVCERCCRVTHVHDDALADLGTRVASAAGFTLGERELTLFGVCGDCRARGG
jgi:Fur family transcriptional regulator, ferric uptake regulator